MTSQNRTKLLDADVLIAAHRNYYAPDICPGFWDCINHHIASGRLLIIDRVLNEIKFPPELVAWVRGLPQHALASTSAPAVTDAYSAMMDWVQNNSQFKPTAKGDFAEKVDGWLVAYSTVNDTCVVTNEAFDLNVRKNVKLSKVCEQFGVNYQDTYAMLRWLEAHFNWEPPA